jgi:hypothetical protein
MDMTMSEIVGSMGVSMLLLAFVMLQLNRLDKEGWFYIALNAVGASLACLSAAMIEFLPFVVLEGVWALSSVVALVQFARSRVAGSDAQKT